MDKLQMQSKNLVDENIEFIAKRFPNCVTEALDEEGKLTKLVDFDMLKQELSHVVIDGDKERYTMTWPDKKQAILTANAPIAKTLRPCREESVDFDHTQNLYIEGDNLDVLKLLRETYLGKIKMIYIDPPYNTGNDFVYNDDFAVDTEEYLERSNQVDEQGNRMVVNNDSNGRFHTDWLNMIYPRLKLAKDLLTDDGVIFISIDDNELANLKKVCDEIFGTNFEGNLIWKTKTAAKGVPTKNMLVTNHDYILVYSKNKEFKFAGEVRDLSDFKNPDNDPRGLWKADNMKSTISTNYFTIKDPETGNEYTKNWAFSKDRIEKMILENKIIWPQDKNGTPRQKRFLREMTNETTPLRTLIGEFQSETATNRLKKIFNETKIFDFTKPIDLIKLLIKQATTKEDTVLDFFSGSATTADAAMQLNAEDGGKRKFIMVQLPEVCDEKSEAYKAGYKNICEIGKERIRRAGQKIKEEIEKSSLIFGKNAKKPLEPTVETKLALQMAYEKIDDPNDRFEQLADKKIPDVGFRDLKLDSSCMKDVYYSPDKTTQDLLTQFEDNIKEDRTPEDLLFQVMLDMGVMLSSEIKSLEINGKKVFNVNDGDLVCCFDKNIDDEVVTAIAKMQPLYAVFRDASMSTDSVAVNFDQIFETYSPTTIRKII